MQQVLHDEHRFVRVCVALFFAVLLLSGLLSFRDAGISWDEKTQYVIGRETYRTVFEGAPVSQDIGRRFHGPSFEFLLYTLQQWLPLKTAQQVFQMRHLAGFFVFYLGVAAFYALSKHHFGSRMMGLMGAMMLSLTPPIYGHAFFNTRDVPTLVAFVVAIFTLIRLIECRTVRWAFIHAISCGLLLSLRMTGILLPVFTFLWLLLTTERGSARRDLLLFGIYAAAFVLSTIALWPLLWENTIGNFIAAYQNMSTKGAGGFYLGKMWGYNPWHWIPVWMMVNIPVLYTALFFIGWGSAMRALIRAPLTFIRTRWRLTLFLAWLFVPVLSVIVLRAGIFDSWRHVFFVYPAFLLIALEGTQWVWRQFLQPHRFIPHPLLARRIFGGMLAANFALIGFWMVHSHPFQYVYFSLPSAYVGKYFELDYWGLSMRKGLEYLLDTDQSPIVPVLVTSSTGYSAYNMLRPEQQKRIRFAGGHDAKYILDNFRGTEYRHDIPDKYKLHELRAGGKVILGIYTNPYWDPANIESLLPLPTDKLVFFFNAKFMNPADASEARVFDSLMIVSFSI